MPARRSLGVGGPTGPILTVTGNGITGNGAGSQEFKNKGSSSAIKHLAVDLVNLETLSAWPTNQLAEGSHQVE